MTQCRRLHPVSDKMVGFPSLSRRSSTGVPVALKREMQDERTNGATIADLMDLAREGYGILVGPGTVKAVLGEK